VTLGRLVLAWAPVALWFVAVAWASERWRDTGHLPRRVARAGVEAGLVTLLASLWFDSLGHGGWWLVFLLVGAIAGLPARLRELETTGAPLRRVVLLGLLDAGRYLAAGGILAWRLA
jgi:hypothetical protein